MTWGQTAELAGAALWFAGFQPTGLALQMVGSATRVAQGESLLSATALGCTAYGAFTNSPLMVHAGMALALVDAVWGRREAAEPTFSLV